MTTDNSVPEVVVFSDLPTLEAALDFALRDERPCCAGASAFGWCRVVPRFAVNVDGSLTRYACGRHLSWLAGRVLSSGQSLTVTDVSQPSETDR